MLCCGLVVNNIIQILCNIVVSLWILRDVINGLLVDLLFVFGARQRCVNIHTSSSRASSCLATRDRICIVPDTKCPDVVIQLRYDQIE